MLGATLQISRGHREDRFYSPSKTLRGYHQHLQCLWKSRSNSSAGVWSVPPLVFNEKSSVSEYVEPEDQTGSEVGPSNDGSVSASSASSSSSLCSSLASDNSRSSNLDRFLDSTTPSITAQLFYKTTMEGCRTCDVQCRPYFTLAELWDSFKEWSAYGASVPLVLNGSDCVVQYYVPYLSGIQLYAKSSGRFGEKSDSDKSKDFTSDGCSEYRSRKCMKSNGVIQNTPTMSMNELFIRNNGFSRMNEFSNDDGETGKSDGMLLFEFLEQNAPHNREPLTIKISDLSRHFPELISLRSCDLLPTSWISVAWYPIYRIPTGTTLKDLDACFLTFHSLSTQTKDDENAARPVFTYHQGNGGVPKISLPIFGLSSYKLKGSMWNPDGECGSQRTSSLLQAADNWLRLVGVKLPDYLFFASHAARLR